MSREGVIGLFSLIFCFLRGFKPNPTEHTLENRHQCLVPYKYGKVGTVELGYQAHFFI